MCADGLSGKGGRVGIPGINRCQTRRQKRFESQICCHWENNWQSQVLARSGRGVGLGLGRMVVSGGCCLCTLLLRHSVPLYFSWKGGRGGIVKNEPATRY